MRRIFKAQGYQTGDSDTDTEKYTWEDLEAAMFYDVSTDRCSENYKAHVDIKKYFKDHPEEALDGYFKNWTVKQIVQFCSVV